MQEVYQINQPVKVLIFSAPYGEGHRSASEALAYCLREKYGERVDTRVIDYFETFTHIQRRIWTFLYRDVTPYWPWGWGAFFAATDWFSRFPRLRSLGLIGLRNARQFLKAYRPDMVISTYPICGQVASELKRELGYLSATVITDFGVHRQWVHPDTDIYFVAAEIVKEDLCAQGISAERVEVTGIPLKARFASTLEREQIRRKYGLPDDVTILLAGGGQRTPQVETLCRRLAPLAVQLLVLCGKNARLFRRVKRLSQSFPNVLPFGFVTDIMAELLTMSHLLVGKAGGLTISEALAKGLPLLIYRPIPGQEFFNTDFLVNEGAALWARDEADVAAKIAFLASRPDRLKQLQANATRLGRACAAEEICKKLLDRWQHWRGFCQPRD